MAHARTVGVRSSPARTAPRRARLAVPAVAVAALVLAVLVVPADARKKAPLTAVGETAWTYEGLYKVRAKKTGLGREPYTLEFVVDFFGDGTFTLQCLPIEEGAEEDFFSGTWIQIRNKVLLDFDALSRDILKQMFEEQFAADFENPVDVLIERWEITMKLRRDRTGEVFMKFTERLRHIAISEGIPVRIKTRGKGIGEFLESIAQ